MGAVKKKKSNRFVYTRYGIRSVGTDEEKMEGLMKAIKLIRKSESSKKARAAKKSSTHEEKKGKDEE